MWLFHYLLRSIHIVCYLYKFEELIKTFTMPNTFVYFSPFQFNFNNTAAHIYWYWEIEKCYSSLGPHIDSKLHENCHLNVKYEFLVWKPHWTFSFHKFFFLGSWLSDCVCKCACIRECRPDENVNYFVLSLTFSFNCHSNVVKIRNAQKLKTNEVKGTQKLK